MKKMVVFLLFALSLTRPGCASQSPDNQSNDPRAPDRRIATTVSRLIKEGDWRTIHELVRQGHGKAMVPLLVRKLGGGFEGVPGTAVAARNSRQRDVREFAATALGKIGADAVEAVPALIKALENEDGWVRLAVVRALGNIGPVAKDAVPPLLNVVREGEAGMMCEASESLGKIGAPAVPALAKALDDERWWVGHWAARALARVGPGAEPAIPSLLKALRGHQFLHEPAGRALGNIGRKAVPALVEALGGDSPEAVRLYATGALARIGQEAVPALVAALDHKDRHVRFHAAVALKYIGPRKKATILRLEKLRGDEDPDVRDAATRALKKASAAADERDGTKTSE